MYCWDPDEEGRPNSGEIVGEREEEADREDPDRLEEPWERGEPGT